VTELPKIVAQRLQTAPHAAHPDPDVITAFVEKSLRESEQDQVLGHLAQCRDCRELVALSLSEHQATLPTVVPVRSSWLAWPVLRWGAIGAGVVVVGAAVSLHYRPATLVSDRSDTPRLVQEAKSSSDATALSAIKASSSQPAETKHELGAPAKKAESVDRMAVAKTKNIPAPAPATRDQSPSIPQQTEVVPVQGADEKAPAGYNALAQTVPGRAKDDLRLASPAASSVAGKETVTTTQAPVATNRKAVAGFATLSPRWTLSTDGTLQRSLDSGLTWEPVPVSGQASFLALAADGMEIWVGGAKGALYHSSDAGQNWTQVQPAANGEVLAGDIIGVEFVDRLHGSLTTSGRQKWVTADAGQTWQKQ
jgi:Photosynthesis system II assembly factor YCF48